MKRESTREGYFGDVITPQNRREYIKKQAELYKEQYLRTTKEEDRKSDEEIEIESLGYGRFRANKEMKHYRSYLAGKEYYKYKGDVFPVMTGTFIKEARTAQKTVDIHKVEKNEEEE